MVVTLFPASFDEAPQWYIFFLSGVVIQNDVAIVIDAASLTKCYLMLRVLPLKVGIIRLVQSPSDIIAENGNGYVL